MVNKQTYNEDLVNVGVKLLEKADDEISRKAGWKAVALSGIKQAEWFQAGVDAALEVQRYNCQTSDGSRMTEACDKGMNIRDWMIICMLVEQLKTSDDFRSFMTIEAKANVNVNLFGDNSGFWSNAVYQ